MKHRRNKVKREHGIIRNALPWLENLSRLSEITDIIPGVIDVNRSSERGIVYKYKTQTGCKLLLKSNGSIQEAFVVTKNPERVLEWVNQEFPPDSPWTSPERLSSNNHEETPKQKLPKVTSNPDFQFHEKSIVQREKRSSKKSSNGKVGRSESSNVVTSNLADRLDNTTLKALKQLKQSLDSVKNQASIPKSNRFPRK